MESTNAMDSDRGYRRLLRAIFNGGLSDRPVATEPKIDKSVPRYCVNCGKELSRVVERVEYDERTGRRRILVWFACPDYDGGRMLYLPDAYIVYWADLYDTDTQRWYDLPSIGYTKYQTCDRRVVYR